MKKEYLIWMLKGAAMGAADAVPGVSGGTMALITGIYERFIAALASFKPSLLQDLLRRDFSGAWQKIDGTFLLFLGSGILISLFSILNLMHWLLAVCAPVVWAFFMGIILVSLKHLMQGLTWRLQDAALMGGGLLIALLLITASGVQVQATPLMLVFGGALAISAMLLPGISGSFMLLLLGLYPVITEAVHERHLIIVFWVALGCLIGILSFSRFLQWLLSHWHDQVIRFMLGFVAGALVKVWPWQVISDDTNQWVLPAKYIELTGQSAWPLASVIALVCGILIVAILHRSTSD